MRAMALDYGTRAVGVAISDELRLTVRPLQTLRGLGRARLIKAIGALAAEYEIGVLVVGLPLRMDGTRGEAAMRVDALIDDLRRALEVPVVACDERLTSREADDLLRERGADRQARRARSDEIAAAIILQDYLAASERAESSSAPATETET
jgi:putative Holliday junction resolvase